MDWNIDVKERLYINLADEILFRIIHEQFPLGSKLPATSQLIKASHTSQETMRKALCLLIERTPKYEPHSVGPPSRKSEKWFPALFMPEYREKGGKLHFPCAGCRQLPLCGLTARKYLALQAVPVQQVYNSSIPKMYST